MALTALENVNAKLVENGAVPQTSTQQALCGLHALVYGLSHLLFPHFQPGTARESIQFINSSLHDLRSILARIFADKAVKKADGH